MRCALRTLVTLAVLALTVASAGCSQNGSGSPGAVDSPLGGGAHLYTNADYGFSIEYVDPLSTTERPLDETNDTGAARVEFKILFLMPQAGQNDSDEHEEGVTVEVIQTGRSIEPGSPEATTVMKQFAQDATSGGAEITAGPEPVEVDGQEAQRLEVLWKTSPVVHQAVTMVFAGERMYLIMEVALSKNWQEYQPFFVPTVNSFKTL
jgi:hypothetical protein